MARVSWLVRGALVALLLPLALGLLQVTYRDALVTHLPGKVATVESLQAGRFPFVNPYASCGEPLAGNPNHAVLFPDVLLFLILPLPAAFGAHYALAALLAYAGARRWARAEGAAREAAEIAGLAFLSSGVFFSAWTFYNAGMALAVAPWVAAAVTKVLGRARSGGRPSLLRAVGELGLLGALEILAGEPVVALLTAVLCAAMVLVELQPSSSRTVRVPRGRSIAALAGAALLTALLASPQILLTWQAMKGSSRDLAHYAFAGATATSVHPARLLEQVVAFPFGRPDSMGEGGFHGQRFFQGTAPYLWTLHLGWVPLLLLLAFGGARSARERLPWLAGAAAALLSLGAFLPGSRLLYPLLSLAGRIRYPVKWWYVVVLALVPLVHRSAQRWVDGERPSRARAIASTALAAAALACGLILGRGDPWLFASAIASGLAALALLATLRAGSSRRAGLLLVGIAAPALVTLAPLANAVLDRPPSRLSPIGAGRLFERVEVAAHDPDLARQEPRLTTRDLFRRATAERWALTGALSGASYAFDADPDGSYSFHDRVMREAVDSLPWSERIMELRLAGVSHVLAREALPPPFRERAVAELPREVRLFDLGGGAAEVRRASRVFRAPHFNATIEIHRSPEFDPATDVVLPGKDPSVTGSKEVGSIVVETDLPDQLDASTDGAQPGVVVWSRTFFPAWRAEVDGQEARVVAADGHLVGVAVPPGPHRVTVVWSRTPLALGSWLFALGVLGLVATLGRRRGAARRDAWSAGENAV